jgi:hypothetical protein
MEHEKTINNYPNPWNFDNENVEMFSPDKSNKIEFYELFEIGMGAPLGGYCHWIDNNGNKIRLNHRFGGPPKWNSQGTEVALPFWTNKFWKGTVQQIIILNIEKKELTRYKKVFDVLDLRTFTENEICGYDSPIYKKKIVKFDLKESKIAEKIKI